MISKKCIIIILIILFVYSHFKKYVYIPKENSIQQIENFTKSGLEEMISSKNPIIIRNYRSKIKLTNEMLDGAKKNSLFNKISLKKHSINILLSPLNFFSKNYVNYGKKNTKTVIINSLHDRSYIHLHSGIIKCYLFSPNQINKLYLKKNGNFVTSQVSMIKPDYRKYPDFKSTEFVEITLRENNLLFLPNYWSYYIEYIEDSIVMLCTTDTIISKIVTIFHKY